MTARVVAIQAVGTVLIVAAFPVVIVLLVEDALRTPPTSRDHSDPVVVCARSPRTDILPDEFEERGVPHVVADADDQVDLSIITAVRALAPDVPVYSVVEDRSLATYRARAGADRVFSPRELPGSGLATRVRPTVESHLGGAVRLGSDVEPGELTIEPGCSLVGCRVEETGLSDRSSVPLIGAWSRGASTARRSRTSSSTSTPPCSSSGTSRRRPHSWSGPTRPRPSRSSTGRAPTTRSRWRPSPAACSRPPSSRRRTGRPSTRAPRSSTSPRVPSPAAGSATSRPRSPTAVSSSPSGTARAGRRPRRRLEQAPGFGPPRRRRPARGRRAVPGGRRGPVRAAESPNALSPSGVPVGMADESKTQTGEILGVPYNFERPSLGRLLSAYWQPGKGMLVEKPFGIGYTLNLASWRSWLVLAVAAGLLWQERQAAEADVADDDGPVEVIVDDD